MADEADAAADLDLLIRAVHRAAEVAQRFDPRRVKVSVKPDGSRVSEADHALDATLAEILRPARPSYGWLSEEGTARTFAERTFICDPIDGTNAYLRGETVWTIVAAVIEGARPLVGVILRPRRDLLYHATRGGGAWRDGHPIGVSARAVLDGARIALPGPLFRDAGLRDAGVVRGPSIASLALRLAKVADGEIDAAITKDGPHHWDLAAADLILHEAGGSLTDLAGAPLRYDTEATAHGSVFAGPAGLCAALRSKTAPFVAA